MPITCDKLVATAADRQALRPLAAAGCNIIES